MSTSLKAKIFAAASVDAGLTALLGTNPFPLYDTQLPQGARFPAIVSQMISNPRDYAFTGILPTGWTRMQYRVYGTGNDSQNADAVVNAMQDFFGSLNLTGIPGNVAYPNFIEGDRDFGKADTQPLTYMRIVDVRIFSNSTL